MEMVSDVWVNWFEGEENGYNVCAFYEWRKDDFIELMDQMPLLKVNKPLFDLIENDLQDLPPRLLKEVRNRGIICKDSRREVIEYCFVATDGARCIAVDTLGYTVPIRKSRLIPRQENMILQKAEQLPVADYPLPAAGRRNKTYHLLSPDPKWMVGLTRKERRLKQLLFMALDQLHASGNVEEMRYWYTEWYPTAYEASRHMTCEQAWQALVSGIRDGWSERHGDLCARLIRGQPYFEKLWALEQRSKVR